MFSANGKEYGKEYLVSCPCFLFLERGRTKRFIHSYGDIELKIMRKCIPADLCNQALPTIDSRSADVLKNYGKVAFKICIFVI